MNIYAEKGEKVVFDPKNCLGTEVSYAEERGLVIGTVYTVKEIDVGDFASYVYLKENTGRFNTVLFQDTEEAH